ncbi:MAG: aldehyde reductase [Myxococcota bacterium]
MSVSDSPVFVTGASGFVASQIIRMLLEQGYRVRGSVRDPAPDKTEPLRAVATALRADDRLELVAADLLQPGSFDAPLQGCELVLHTASPYLLTPKDALKDLVEPAEQGTLNVLRAAQKARAKRVVLTSSVAAMTDQTDAKAPLDEKSWNKTSSLRRNPYYYSKVRAERAAWDFVGKEKPGFRLVAVNPFVIIGPSLVPGLNTSNQIFADLLNGKYPGILALDWGLVDVRDVALAHLLALTTPKAKGRYLCAAGVMSMREVVAVLVKRGYGKKFPKLAKTAGRSMDHAFGNLAVRLGSFFQPRGTGTYLRTHIGRKLALDNGLIKKELGLTFRSIEQSLVDTVEDLIRWGHVPAPEGAS